MTIKRYSVDPTTCGEYPYCGASVEENPEGEYFRVVDVVKLIEELATTARSRYVGRTRGGFQEACRVGDERAKRAARTSGFV